VKDLVACHDEHPWLKFLGACNPAKAALDRCFKVRARARARGRVRADIDPARACPRPLAQREKEIRRDINQRRGLLSESDIEALLASPPPSASSPPTA
jgi:hypothetical protein